VSRVVFAAGSPPLSSGVWGLGNILGDVRQYLARALRTMRAPGAALMLAVLGVNLLGDEVRDLLDPRLRKRWPVVASSQPSAISSLP
jgi:ABC-type antimicrobial peptide transport system permease subunit